MLRVLSLSYLLATSLSTPCEQLVGSEPSTESEQPLPPELGVVKLGAVKTSPVPRYQGNRATTETEPSPALIQHWAADDHKELTEDNVAKQYVGTIAVGYGGKKSQGPFTMIFDTGSSDVWVPSENIYKDSIGKQTSKGMQKTTVTRK